MCRCPATTCTTDLCTSSHANSVGSSLSSCPPHPAAHGWIRGGARTQVLPVASEPAANAPVGLGWSAAAVPAVGICQLLLGLHQLLLHMLYQHLGGVGRT